MIDPLEQIAIISVSVTLLVAIVSGWVSLNSRVSELMARVEDLRSEIERVRNRLDRFLDGRIITTASGHD